VRDRSRRLDPGDWIPATGSRRLDPGDWIPADELAADELAADELAALIAEAREVTAAEVRAALLLGADVVGLAGARRRGPGLSGPMEDGEYSGPLGFMAHGGAGDTARPSGTLAGVLEDVTGSYAQATDDEIVGVVCAWSRMVAWATGQLYGGLAEFLKRRPADELLEGGLPLAWAESAVPELAQSLGESRGAVEAMLGTARSLAARLPGTTAGLLDGDLSDEKARIIVRGTSELTPEQAQQAEQAVLGRAAKLTPGGLRSAVSRVVIEIDPDAARRRREAAARTRRVEVRPEESGNSMVSARELPAEAAAAIDAQLSARADELHRHGIGQDTGDRRVLALLEKFGLAGDLPGAGRNGAGRNGASGNGGGAGAGSRGPAVPAKLTLTATVGTLAGLRDRPGELASHGPVDPDLARRLAAAALRHPGSKVAVIVTDEQGQMTGYGAARPPTKAERDRIRRHRTGRPGYQSSTGPPGGGRQVLTFTPVPVPVPEAGQLKSGSGYGTWLIEPAGGGQDLIVTLKAISTDPCDHRMQTAAHDPGRELREVTMLRYATCTNPVCRRPAARCDWEHNIPYEVGGRTCLCNGNPECRFDHGIKQSTGWTVRQHPDGRIAWTTPTGRTAVTEPHRYPTD
jgi:Domain of unknown function (DUF222)